jgi:protein-tyrosine sulfotransferase
MDAADRSIGSRRRRIKVLSRQALIQQTRIAASRVRLAAPWGGHPLQRQEPIEPFFIIGAGRSGTTLLRRILMGDPDVFIPPETYVLGNVIKNFKLLQRLTWPTIVTCSVAQFEYHAEFVRFGTTLRPLVHELRQAPPEVRSLAFLLDRFFHFAADQTGWPHRSRWGDKTPRNSYHLDAISSVFPKAKFIHLVRDGYDVVESVARVDDSKRRDDPLEAARYWRRSVRACQEFGRRRRFAFRELKYEALVGDPEPEVRRLCQFLGLEYSPTMLDVDRDLISRMGDVTGLDHHAHVAESISTRFLGRGRRHLAPAVLRDVEAVIGQDNANLGYPPAARP